ncbi:MAG: hypothetical protein R3B48_05635 [Kofleriaceae bacterium]
MSTKAKSKNESARSPADGASPEDVPAPRAKASNKAESVTVYLASDRQRRATWVAFGLLGAILLWKLGTVAAVAGIALVAAGLYQGWFLLRSFRYRPGAVIVEPGHVVLPRGLSEPTPPRTEASALVAVYFLRYHVPWHRAAPVLVVETRDRAFLYPRDWFASEADQRRLMHAMLHAMPHVAKATGDTDAKP